ncbi:hypothetical protein SDC9_96707 [bioreactor metagenome]|uniref:Uncharacterized protein n=1 Tax=bioreactor metagenome TaxID=1076179 RepID=A0A645AGL4_9ZZZZ
MILSKSVLETRQGITSIFVYSFISSMAKKFNGSTIATISLLSFLSIAINLYFFTILSGINVATLEFISYLLKSTLGNPSWSSKVSTISSGFNHPLLTTISPSFILFVFWSSNASFNCSWVILPAYNNSSPNFKFGFCTDFTLIFLCLRFITM